MTKFVAFGSNIADSYFNIRVRLDISQFELKKLLNLTSFKNFRINLSKPENIDIINKEFKEKFKCNEINVNNYDNSRLIVYCKYSMENLTNLKLIRDTLKINIDSYGKKLLLQIYPKDFEKLESLAAKIHRMHLMDWNKNGDIGFYITKFLSSSSRYVNSIITIPDIPILSILRMKLGSDKLVNTENKQFHIDAIRFAEWGERKSSYFLNNYIKSKIKSAANEYQRIIFSTDLVNLALISSLRGITNEDGILIPWPFSSFQLATNNYEIYTIFLANIKIKDIIIQNTDKLLQIIFNDKINKINYKYYKKLLLMKAKVNLVDLYDALKTIEKEINLVTTEDINKILNIDKNKHYLGVIMGKSFTSIFNSPLLLIHAYDGSNNKQLLEFIKKFDESVTKQNVINSALDYNSVRIIKESIYNMAYSNDKLHILSLTGVDDLLKLQLIAIKIYKLVHEILYEKELKIRYLLSIGF